MAAVASVLLLLSRLTITLSTTIYSGTISPNFTASHFLFIENSGEFLRSVNRNYTAAIKNPKPSSSSFYLVVYHSASHTVVWTANRNTPVSSSGQFHLSATGISIHDDSEDSVWSTPDFSSTVASLQLLDSGNLILLDRFNTTLWQSFDFPTDTIVSGQRFLIGKSLIAYSSPSEYSDGEYTFMLTSTNGILQWQGLTYYELSMDCRSIQNSAQPVSYMMVNGSGFNLIGESGSEIVTKVLMPPVVSDSDYRILKISNEGYLVVLRYTNNNWVTDFASPVDRCRSPSRCGKLGLCSTGGCSCPPGYHIDPKTNFGCSLSDISLLLPESCNGDETRPPEDYVYVPIGTGLMYFSIYFTNPARNNVGLSTCEALCSSNCSCLAFYYGSRSESCYLIANHLGSNFLSSNKEEDDKLGFIKAISLSSSSNNQNGTTVSDFPVIGLVLLPASGVLLISIVAIWMCIRTQKNKKIKMKPIPKKFVDDSYSDDTEKFLIAGLPVRFKHEDLVHATMNFSTRIGSGGFGTVYKGVLRDKTVVAVKRRSLRQGLRG
ncbi:hypothetical protein R6Q57_014930 [Mikania cordata]